MAVVGSTSGVHGRRGRGNLSFLTSVVLVLLGLLVSFPFVWTVRSSLMLQTEAMHFPPLWLPSRLTLDNYRHAFTIQPMARYVLNSLFIATITIAGRLVTASMGAFAFARLQFPWRDKLFLLYLATMMIPYQVTLIPMFVLVSRIGWLDSYMALIVPGVFSAYTTFLLRQSFLSIPVDLEDAARIDGAGYFRVFTTVAIPLSKAALATCGLLGFIGSWTSFVWPLIIIRSRDLRTIPIGLAALKSEMFMTDYPQIMAGATVAVIPIIILFLFLQRYIVEGIALSGLKG
jgi:multiple sugar transport system permease protein